MSWIELLRDLGVFGAVAWTLQALIKRGIDRAAIEHRVRYSALHERRVKVIEETYQRLIRSEQTLKWASDMSPADEEIRERLAKFSEEANGFFDYFTTNRIWLSKALCERLDSFWTVMKDAGYSALDSLSPHREVSRLDCRKVMAEKCDPLKTAIEAEFRQTLGVV